MTSEPRPLRSGDYLLAVLGLAALRDLFHAPANVTSRVEEMHQVVSHADEFPFDFDLRFVEHDVVDGYTEWSTSYDQPETNPAIMIEEHLTGPMLAAAPSGRALDVACGTGRVLRRLADLGYDVAGADLTPAMLRIAASHLPAAELHVAPWTELPFGDGSFELVTCSLALCHATDVAPPIAEMARVLRPGGRLVISDMHPFSTMLGGAAAYPGSDIAEIPFVRNHIHQLSEYFTAFTAAGLTVKALEEGRSDERHAALLPSHAAFPDATVRAFAGSPTIVAWAAEKATRT